MKIKILVTGADGQLGNCIREIAKEYSNLVFDFTDVNQLDITSQSDVESYINEHKPDWVVNAAAYTAVDKAETETQLALLLNANAVEFLAEATAAIGAGLVQISTDYVFRGDSPQSMTEEALPSPISVYGITKLQGEIEAEKNPKHIVIRTSWLYSTYGTNFVKTMRRLGAENKEINVVSDQWGNPTSAHDLAEVILIAIQNPVYGVYNYSNEGATSWAIFAEKIMEYSNIDCIVNHITTAEYPTDAERPQYSLMNKEKITSNFGVEVPEWEHSLEKVIGKIDTDLFD